MTADVEKSLLSIWSQVLSIPQLGVHDDFFELGGQSLLAAQILTRVYESTGVRLPIRSFFETRTVAAMAVLLETTLWASRNAPAADQRAPREEFVI